MYMDKQLEFSDGQAITATADSTNVIDLGVGRNLGVGERLYLMLDVTEAFTDSSSDSTVTVTLTTDDNESLSSDTVIATFPVFAALSAVGVHYYNLPIDVTYERYLGLVYTVANGSLTTGKFKASIVKDIQKYTAHASGYVSA